MSRSSRAGAERAASPVPAAQLLTATLLVIVATAGHPSTAWAEDTAPVLPIVAPVLDIQFGESDLRREARVEQLPRKTTITLDSTVLFAKDSATINRKANARLQEVARELKTRGPGSVSVTGYTDDLGSAAYGKTLSLRRANAVTAVLRRDLSGSDFPFTVAGKGEADPAVPNKDEASRRINRRVVVIYQQR
jgi:outer membrane protein OmpA-like peptidoglycan-associated protein